MLSPLPDEDLFQMARQAALQAYSPYSEVKVGCVLETVAGKIYEGCNVENASYGLTLCAERVAVGRAVAVEGPTMRWRRIAVVALEHEFPPCGACRQVMIEFAEAESRVHFLVNGSQVSMRMRDLLPSGFDRGSLGK